MLYRLRLLCLLCFFVCMRMTAQNASGQSLVDVNGSAVDATGAALRDIHVALVDADGKELAQAITGSDGHFTLRRAPAGMYTLVSEASGGFAGISQPLTVQASMTEVRFIIPLASVEQAVDVKDESLSNDAASNKDTISLDSASLESLPVFDQDYIALLTPFLDQSALGSGGAEITIDGVPANVLNITASAIKEIRINNDPYSAESNRPGRSRIDIVTKQPTRDYHGTLNFFFRDSALNAANYFAPVKPAEQRRIYEGSLLGPLYGHYGFLLSANRREQDLASSVHAVGPNGILSSNVATPTRDEAVTLRVGRDFTDTHSAYVQYRVGLGSDTNLGVGGLVLPEAGTNFTSREDQLSVNDRLILTPHLVNLFGITLERQQENVHSVTNAPAILVNGSFVGGGAQADVYRTENNVILNEVVSWSHGRHYIRFGANFPQISRRAWDDQSNRLGSFSFAGLASYQANTPYVYTVQQGPGRTVFWFNELGGFFQDQIKLTQTVQVSLGLRYDWQTYLNDNNNLAPRVSIAWQPRRSPATVLRAGSGVFFDRSGGDPLAYITLHNGVLLRSYQVENPGYPSPGVNLAGAPINYVRFSSAIRTPYSIQYSVGVERKLSRASTLTIAYRGAIGVGLLRSRDANAPVGPAYATRPNPFIGQIQTIESKGRQQVNALDVNFQGSVGKWFSGQAQYTLGRILNNTSGIFFLPQDQTNPSGEWSRANQDRLHRLNLLANLVPGHWYSIGMSLTAYSGAPYTETLGTDPYGDGLGNARPVGIGRNTLQTANYVALDLRWAHDLHLTKAKGEHAKVLTFGVDAFNVLNHPNFSNYSGSLSSPLFSQATAASAGRQMQFTARYRF